MIYCFQRIIQRWLSLFSSLSSSFVVVVVLLLLLLLFFFLFFFCSCFAFVLLLLLLLFFFFFCSSSFVLLLLLLLLLFFLFFFFFFFCSSSSFVVVLLLLLLLFFFLLLLFAYLSSPNLWLTPPGTYKPNVRGSYASRGSNSLWMRTLDIHKACGHHNVRAFAEDNTRQHTKDRPNPRIGVEIPDPAGNRTRASGLEGRDSTDHATATDYQCLFSSTFSRASPEISRCWQDISVT